MNKKLLTVAMAAALSIGLSGCFDTVTDNIKPPADNEGGEGGEGGNPVVVVADKAVNTLDRLGWGVTPVLCAEQAVASECLALTAGDVIEQALPLVREGAEQTFSVKVPKDTPVDALTVSLYVNGNIVDTLTALEADTASEDYDLLSGKLTVTSTAAVQKLSAYADSTSKAATVETGIIIDNAKLEITANSDLEVGLPSLSVKSSSKAVIAWNTYYNVSYKDVADWKNSELDVDDTLSSVLFTETDCVDIFKTGAEEEGLCSGFVGNMIDNNLQTPFSVFVNTSDSAKEEIKLEAAINRFLTFVGTGEQADKFVEHFPAFIYRQQNLEVDTNDLMAQVDTAQLRKHVQAWYSVVKSINPNIKFVYQPNLNKMKLGTDLAILDAEVKVVEDVAEFFDAVLLPLEGNSQTGEFKSDAVKKDQLLTRYTPLFDNVYLNAVDYGSESPLNAGADLSGLTVDSATARKNFAYNAANALTSAGSKLFTPLANSEELAATMANMNNLIGNNKLAGTVVLSAEIKPIDGDKTTVAAADYVTAVNFKSKNGQAILVLGNEKTLANYRVNNVAWFDSDKPGFVQWLPEASSIYHYTEAELSLTPVGAPESKDRKGGFSAIQEGKLILNVKQ